MGILKESAHLPFPGGVGSGSGSTLRAAVEGGLW